jgi:hypothetical protein
MREWNLVLGGARGGAPSGRGARRDGRKVGRASTSAGGWGGPVRRYRVDLSGMALPSKWMEVRRRRVD